MMMRGTRASSPVQHITETGRGWISEQRQQEINNKMLSAHDRLEMLRAAGREREEQQERLEYGSESGRSLGRSSASSIGACSCPSSYLSGHRTNSYREQPNPLSSSAGAGAGNLYFNNNSASGDPILEAARREKLYRAPPPAPSVFAGGGRSASKSPQTQRVRLGGSLPPNSPSGSLSSSLTSSFSSSRKPLCFSSGGGGGGGGERGRTGETSQSIGSNHEGSNGGSEFASQGPRFSRSQSVPLRRGGRRAGLAFVAFD